MRADAAAHIPFHTHFKLDILATLPTRRAAHALERHFIQQFQTQGADGYNKLPGAPGESAAFYYMHRRRLV